MEMNVGSKFFYIGGKNYQSQSMIVLCIQSNNFIMSIKEGKETHQFSFQQQSQSASSNPSLFSLLPADPAQSFFPPVTITFHSSSRQQKNTNSSLPRFNKDGLYNTPSFITEQGPEQENSCQSSKEERSMDQQWKLWGREDEMVRNVLEQLVPKPMSNFCQICKTKYGDYLKHVESIYHEKELNRSYYQREIKKISSQINKTIKSLHPESFHRSCLGTKKHKKHTQIHNI